MSVKLCPKCKNEKNLDAFGNDKQNKDGLSCWCKECRKEARVIWQNNNTEKVSASKKKYVEKNREIIRKKARLKYEENKGIILIERKIWYHENKEIHDGYKKKWIKNNSYKSAFYAAARRVIKANATPSWLKQTDYEFMEVAYAMAKIMTEKTGQKHHVDHIDPLNGKEVCGLHVPLNIRVILAKENLAKGNRLVKE